MEMDSPTYQSHIDGQIPSVEEDILMEDAAAALSPAMQKMSELPPEVSPFSAGDGQESDFPVGDNQSSLFPVEGQQVTQFSAANDQTSHYCTEVEQGSMFSASTEVDRVSEFPSEIKQESHYQTQNEGGTDFSAQNAQAAQFQSQDGQGAFFAAQDTEGSPFVARDDLVCDIPVVEALGSQFSAISHQVPHFPVEHQSSEYRPEDERCSQLSVDDDQACHYQSEDNQGSHYQAESGQDSHFPGNVDPGSHLPVYNDPTSLHQEEPGADFSADEASEFQSAEDQSVHFTAQEGVSSSQFPSADAHNPQIAPEGQGDPNVLSADDEGSHFPAESGLLSEIKTEDDDGSCPLSVEQDQGSLDQLDMVSGAQPTPESSRKRKLAVFAAAGAVIAIQTMLVAMPEIWQPLEDDESAEKVAYQEGLHSWFGALNRAAWLLSTANGAGDGGWWVKPRTSVWFNTYLMSSNEDDRWLAAIRMKRRTFLWICNSLEVHVRKQDTRLRPSIPVTVRVGATIYRLVNGVDYYEVADKFGVGESSVHEIMQDCVPAIVRVFGHHLRWPTGEAMAEVSKLFLDKCGLPNCQGALGSTHVEILNPSGPEAKKYINRTGHFSIVLQGVADPSLSFLDVYCGYPERTYENKVLKSSSLYQGALAGEILAGPIHPINGGFQLRPYILGGSNYPLLPWLMVPYAPSPSLSYSHEQFIHHHEQGKIYTQQAFDILKRVFRVLGIGIRGRLELAPTIVHACCLLHNILIRRKELDVEAELENIGATSHTEDAEEGSSEPGDASSVEIRNQLSEYLVWAS